MIFHKAGKYNNDESILPTRAHPANAVQFKEFDIKTLGLVANGGGALTIILLLIPFVLLGKPYMLENGVWVFLALLVSNLLMVPHELLHAIWYKEDVYFYTNAENGLLFIIGTEDMSKSHFIFMCLFPNLVFGFIPYIIFLIWPQLVGFGFLGLMCIGMGFGDYINIFNALTQMPKGAKTYLSGLHSYWYLPNE